MSKPDLVSKTEQSKRISLFTDFESPLSKEFGGKTKSMKTRTMHQEQSPTPRTQDSDPPRQDYQSPGTMQQI